ncbi:hypothetical protein ENH_00006770 [Eimeria necatrix]|uniref:Uncharacterized protein n=1 Tax=Eimeria necatrix TaxID=51315 RepID=U6MMN6_9EIME|nr:hypothetical protein ENH_00006770 [Eimeria necatrix]CDJ65281.1 hypothetical protein ENH_00006770 [Eimeria necatrix]
MISVHKDEKEDNKLLLSAKSGRGEASKRDAAALQQQQQPQQQQQQQQREANEPATAAATDAAPPKRAPAETRSLLSKLLFISRGSVRLGAWRTSSIVGPALQQQQQQQQQQQGVELLAALLGLQGHVSGQFGAKEEKKEQKTKLEFNNSPQLQPCFCSTLCALSHMGNFAAADPQQQQQQQQQQQKANEMPARWE